ncbi:MAG: LCP family protein [Clostridiales bacterium]|jgi:LCP family protein required for cell wall assembly|nr:LCP family protein [Clostridiales bacterium]
MTNLSRPKFFVACAVILIVLLIPAYVAFNAQNGAEDGTGAVASTGGGLADGSEDGQGEGGAAPPPEGMAWAAADGGAGPAATPSHAPVIFIEQARPAAPTASPAPTATPKWVPEHMATDGELIRDGLVAEDSTNILILGIDRTAHLADTVGVVSFDRTGKTVKLIMFPRDIYIGYSDEVQADNAAIHHAKLPGEYKINNVYNVAKNTEKISDVVYNRNKFGVRGFDFFAQVIYEKFDIEVDDYLQINTYGLVKLVDTFGGVSVYVPTYMRYHDPDQNLNINLSKGMHNLNGTQAEGFVRFRQGYGSSGKIEIYSDRTQNQIAFLKAFYEQHAKLKNISKIPQILDLLKKNVSYSVSADEVFTKYIDILTEVVNEAYTFESVSFETDDKRINGSLYMTIK